MGYHLPSCVRILQASYIVEILREVGAPGLHIKSVSEQSGASRKRSYDHKGIIELDSILGVLLGSPEITRNQGLRESEEVNESTRHYTCLRFPSLCMLQVLGCDSSAPSS
ncbi:hypothetical protein K443DRAFT_429558 [Laccaria amethystina LaAM-08-1]|uniref:Uncharacterized protein n=1 Tax=Laccaria amethystina LaAM-08-1 TaxID=1095629 RepID=A0A0C9X8C2_9AGAR|nr:hypothetical protein K443DRAFT_429558 [Laccaria amethystina LaAM-08-1]